MTDEPPIEFVRIFISDGSYADARLVGPWEAFVHQLITHGCVVTSDTWINRSAIVKMLKMQALSGGPESELVLMDAKGSA